MRQLIIFLGLSYLVSLDCHASTCLNTIKQISDDTSKNSFALSDPKIAWTHLSWLTKELGKPQVSQSNQEYHWVCPEGESVAWLTVQTEADGKFLGVSGQYSSSEGASIFKAPQNNPQSAENDSAQVQPVVESPNKPQVNTNNAAETKNQKHEDFHSENEKYIEVFAACKPGTYSVPDILQMGVTGMQIAGFDDEGNCIVNYLFDGKVGISCHYSQDAIPILIDNWHRQERELDEKGTATSSSADAASQIVTKSCTFPNE